ncbi:hypothetical protein QYE76_002849 [Lolium multiflorum]|uniref:Uncharacterized protein n=1 Tax=Lolium multiflorum TaxID=4521 RepID=A0AAD8VZW9_LOLMU|nr:hypothetical protein QYE76_002849 [Lolium multiflorum]
MWLYSGSKDETRINIAELSEKELLDEVRRLTLFSQEDSIPLISSYSPLDADHPPSEIPIVSGNLHDLPNDTSEGRGSSVPVDFHTAEYTGPESEHDDPIDSEAVHTDLPSSANDACDTEGSVRDDDADCDAFVNAAVEETRASPVKRSTGGFADEDDLFDIDEGFIEPPSKKAKSGATPLDVAASEASALKAAPAPKAANIPANALDKIPNNSPANGVSMTLASHQLTRELLEKGKGAMARMHSMIFPKINQDKTLGQLIDAFAVDTKEVIELEKDLRNTYAFTAIIKKKGEIAADVERYALTELHKATEIIALNRAEENKRIHERVHALTQLSSAEEIFWREHSKASAVAQFQDRVQQVHHFFDKCYKALRIRDLVRAQVFAGARFTLALVLARYPSANLLTIANAVGDLETL